MKRIALTVAMCDALAAIERAEQVYRPGLDSASIVGLPKLALADATVDAVRLARLPRPRPARAAIMTKRRKHA